MSDIPAYQADKLTDLLKKLEARTELEACAVITREGLRIACAVNAEVDADVYSAASAALVNLGETTLQQLRHGGLKEIIVRGDDGYTILTQAGTSHMVVGSCKKLSRMGYYLALLHRFSNKVAKTLGTEIYEEAPVAEFPPTQLEPLELPAAEESYQAPQPTYEEPLQPQEYTQPVGYEAAPQEEFGFDKSALFDALQTLGGEETPSKATSQEVEVNQNSLMEALKPRDRPIQAPFQQQQVQPSTQFVPAATHEEDEEDMFKISDKDAVLEALKVLGWEEPEE